MSETQEKEITIIEKNVHRTNLQRLKDTLCLFIPIASAFVGFLLPGKTAPELLKFGAAVLMFIITSTIVFIITRKINPIMKIGIFSEEDAPSQEH